MKSPTLRVEKRDRVAFWTIDRPECLNALNVQVLTEILDAMAAAEADPGVRAVVLSGSGDRAFSAGGDLKDVRALETDPYGVYETDGLFTRVLAGLRRLSKPTVAAVQGLALGGGCGLAAGCDFVVASDRAAFGTPEINVGLFPMMIMAPLVEVLGPKVALELFLTGGRLDAQEAKALGLVNRIVPYDDFDAGIRAFVRPLLEKSPAILKLGKQAFYQLQRMGYEQALEHLRAMKSVVTLTADSREGLAAFAQKRPPEWTGN